MINTIKRFLSVPEGFRRLSLVAAAAVSILIFIVGFQSIDRSIMTRQMICYDLHKPDFMACLPKCKDITTEPRADYIHACQMSCEQNFFNTGRLCVNEYKKEIQQNRLVLYPLLIGLCAMVSFRLIVKLVIWLIAGFKEKA